MSPLGKQVLLKKGEAQTKVGKIFLPVAKDTNIGEVIGVGPKAEMVVPGHRVLYNPARCRPFNYEGEDYLLTSEDDLLIIL